MEVGGNPHTWPITCDLDCNAGTTFIARDQHVRWPRRPDGLKAVVVMMVIADSEWQGTSSLPSLLATAIGDRGEFKINMIVVGSEPPRTRRLILGLGQMLVEKHVDEPVQSTRG